MKTPCIGNIMKNSFTLCVAVACMVIASATYGQHPVESPEAAGLTPLHGTIYVNDDTNSLNNGGVQVDNIWGADITGDHKVVICLTDFLAATDFVGMGNAWTLYDTNGNRLIPPTVITNVTGAAGNATLTNTWRSFYRTNGVPMPCNNSRSPKARANRFGSGFVVGGRGDRIGLEIATLFAINEDDSGALDVSSAASGFPIAQLMNNSGTAVSPVVAMGTDADYQPVGNVFCHGAEILANGNIVLVGECRQNADLIDRWGGSIAKSHAVYAVVKPNGDIVKPYSLSSEQAVEATQFNAGVGVTSNGFAIRFDKGGPTFRLFDNDGNPTSGDINMAAQVGTFLGGGPEPTAGAGGRGDGVGWHGNYKDAYVNVCAASGGVYVTVYNADGSVRYHRQTFDVGFANNGDRVDGAIAPDGRVVIAIDDNQWDTNSVPALNRLVFGRILDAAGNPMGPHFAVSELATPYGTGSDIDSRAPRVSWRDNLIAFTWRIATGPVSSLPVVGYRLFKETPPVALSLTRSAGNLVLSWPTNAPGYTLRSTGNLASGTWQTNSPAPVTSGSVFTVTEPVGPANKFYQLIK